MSKSKGNVIDPLEVIHGCDLKALLAKLDEGNLPEKEVARAKAQHEKDFGEDGIPTCGADALRIGLLAYTIQGRNINLDIKRVVGYRNFCNKLWQGTRFLLGCIGGDFQPTAGMADALVADPSASRRDLWILSKLNSCVDEATKTMEAYEFGRTVHTLHAFFINHLCDVYLELIKPVVYGNDQQRKAQAQGTLWTCLDTYLRLLHPICPFVTEELWQRLPKIEGGGQPASIMIAPWPLAQPAWSNATVESGMALLLECVAASRSMRSEHNMNKRQADYIICCATQPVRDVIQAQTDDFSCLAMAQTVECIVAEETTSDKMLGVRIVNDQVKVYMDPGEAVVDNSAQIKKLQKEVKTLTPLVEKLQKKLADPQYKDKVPPKIFEKDTTTLASYEKKRNDALKALERFNA